MRTGVKGSILLETILALLFVVLTVGAVAGLFINSMQKVRQSELRTRAMFLAENKLAEMQVGLVDVTDTSSGDFAGKPAKFTWQIDLEPTQVPELQRLKITINYDDPADGFSIVTYRLYSPGLNLSAEKMKDIAADPVKMKALGSSSGGLENLLSMTSELPGGDKIKEAFLRGGIPGMMDLFNKVVSGKITAEELLAAAVAQKPEDKSFTAMLANSGLEEKKLLAWTDYDTAGLGENPETTTQPTGLASKDDKKTNPTTKPGSEAPEVGRPGEARAQAQTGNTTGTDTEATSPGTMTRDEAIKRMTEMLRRMANQRK